MKLVRLKLLNFRKFREETINFDSSFSVVYGKNWAWKSSVVDAIWLALFWVNKWGFSRWNKQNLKSDYITDRSPCKIELIFEIWGRNYRIVRVFDKWIKSLDTLFIEENKDILLFWDEEIIW